MPRRDPIDEFESMFKRAEREPFVYSDVPLQSATVVTDRPAKDASDLRDPLVAFLPTLRHVERWNAINVRDAESVQGVLDRLIDPAPDLIVTWRLLAERPPVPPHSLGVYLDVLTQATPTPVLVLPGTAFEPAPLQGRVVDRVMVITSQIAGDSRLINYGVRLCQEGGKVWIGHIEDERVFERYMRAIERIPEIETETARQTIGHQLLKEARDFIESAVDRVRQQAPHLRFEPLVTFGHRLTELRQLIDEHAVDLLVFNTKDADQLAMHGLAYSLAVEFTEVAMLLL